MPKEQRDFYQGKEGLMILAKGFPALFQRRVIGGF